MNKQEQDAIHRIKESLEEFPDSRMAQHILSADLNILVSIVEKTQKK
ncbi:hypothetical protein SDC9_207565 [bioreactor metagenome]|uniref:Uncharacterized protein n=1 Tax=bioreactor metagenome TaxID=1076179 RepID=A0A645JJP4_9ZZZZ